MTLSETSLGLISLESFCIIGVNVFVLITGYFSTRPKLSSLLNLFYICIFYGIIKRGVDLAIGNPIPLSGWFLFTRSNWFIPTYLGLVLFSPALNALCENTNKKKLLGVILTLLAYETYMGFFPAQPQIPVGFEHGCSVLSFMVLYLVGRYIYLYGFPIRNKKLYIPIYFVCSIILILIEYISLSKGLGKYSSHIFDSSNPLIIFASICFFVFFSKLDIGVNRAINHISKSVLAVLLVHASGTAMRYLNPHYINIYNNYAGIALVLYWILSISLTFALSVVIDQVRIWSYKYVSTLLHENRNNNSMNK